MRVSKRMRFVGRRGGRGATLVVGTEDNRIAADGNNRVAADGNNRVTAGV